ncbi:hypothetical protein D3C80_1724870 [compost metagenome]
MRAFNFCGNGAHGIKRRRCAHGDFDGLQTASNQCTRQRDGRGNAVNNQNRHNRLKFQDGKKFFRVLRHDGASRI